MSIYNDRTYRNQLHNGRWHGFIVKHKETDVWVGVDKLSFKNTMPDFTKQIIIDLRNMIDVYLLVHPQYALSLNPCNALSNAPVIIKQMAQVSFQTMVGPMAAIAGAFATHIANELKRQFQIEEIIVENGGDIYADIKQNIDVSVFAGNSPLSEKIGLHIDAKETPLGICTSSGTVGHSLSFGKADAVMIVCKDALLADAYATAFANKIQSSHDIKPVLKLIENEKDIVSALLVKDDKMGVIGKFELKLFR